MSEHVRCFFIMCKSVAYFTVFFIGTSALIAVLVGIAMGISSLFGWDAVSPASLVVFIALFVIAAGSFVGYEECQR